MSQHFYLLPLVVAVYIITQQCRQAILNLRGHHSLKQAICNNYLSRTYDAEHIMMAITG